MEFEFSLTPSNETPFRIVLRMARWRRRCVRETPGLAAWVIEGDPLPFRRESPDALEFGDKQTDKAYSLQPTAYSLQRRTPTLTGTTQHTPTTSRHSFSLNCLIA